MAGPGPDPRYDIDLEGKKHRVISRATSISIRCAFSAACGFQAASARVHHPRQRSLTNIVGAEKVRRREGGGTVNIVTNTIELECRSTTSRNIRG